MRVNMKNILLVLSSPRGRQSYSHQFAGDIVDDLKLRHPAATVVVRDLATEPLPHVGEAFVGGLFSRPEQRTPDQATAMARSDRLIDELFATDVVVIAAPMHNFGPPSTLKAWFDHIVRAGRTFAYTDKGPEGLLKGKKAIVVLARGGVYSHGPAKARDFQEPYVRSMLDFIGITDVHVVRVEGVAMGEDAVKRAMASAREQADTVARAFA
jgi:FMN-dependent NADH-azoreductase